MSSEITNQDKIDILNRRMHNLLCIKYDIELAVLEANAVNYPDAANLENLRLQNSDVDLKISAITNILNSLEDEGS